MHKASVQFPALSKQDVVVNEMIPALRMVRQEGLNCEVILDCKGILRPVWTYKDPVSNINKEMSINDVLRVHVPLEGI